MNPSMKPSATIDLESKLQSAVAQFRQDRDTVRRRHQLATEKVRLIKQEYNAVLKGMKMTESKGAAAKAKMESKAAKAHHTNLMNGVDRLQKEVRGILCS